MDLSRLSAERAELTLLRALNLLLLVAFPVSWFAPLARAGLLPLFQLDSISVVSGIRALWQSDAVLAALVALFALVAPVLKTLALSAVQFGRLGPRALPVLEILGKLAMADVFLIALYIVLAKGVGVGRVETGWGLYLFTGCVLVSILVTHLTKRRCPPFSSSAS